MKKKSSPPIGPNEWQLYGRCCNTSMKNGEGTPPDINTGITFKEQISNLRWDAKPFPARSTSDLNIDVFGKPIEGNLAGKLIKAAHNTIQDFTKKVNSKNFEGNDKKNNQAVANFLSLTNGITFDRTIVLKILSQPNCEGLRAYLCQRDDVDEQSLVLVGVDAHGFDLNFPVPKNVKEKAATTDIPNQSLMAEYGYPPGSKKKSKAKWKSVIPGIDPHYVLLTMA